MTTPGFHWRGRTRRSVFATAGAAGAGLLAAACGQAATTTTTTSAAPTSAAAGASSASGLTGTIKIVSSLPRTGTDKGQTDTMVNGIKMALDEAGGKVGGATVTYEDWDDATAAAGHWDPAQETSNANKAAADKDIMVYIGTFNSGAAKLAIPILGQAGPLVMISPANTYPGLTKPGKGDKDEPDKYYPTKVRNYTRVVPADDIQGAVAAQWGKDLGAKSVYILDDQDLYGKGIADVFDASAKKIGLNVLGHEGIDPKASDYKALMTKIKNLNPDLIYYGGITADGGPQLVKDKIGAGMPNDKVKFMGPDGIQEQAFIDGTGKDAAEGVYATFGGVPPDKLTGKALDWANKYKAKYGGELASYTIYAYEAMKVALDAIQRAGKKDRKAIRDALFSTKNFDKGALGTWSFDDNGDTTITAMSGVQVQGGKWVFQKELKTS
jgi:branched-chain amino acid transport system substrate-binding protein